MWLGNLWLCILFYTYTKEPNGISLTSSFLYLKMRCNFLTGIGILLTSSFLHLRMRFQIFFTLKYFLIRMRISKFLMHTDWLWRLDTVKWLLLHDKFWTLRIITHVPRPTTHDPRPETPWIYTRTLLWLLEKRLE